MHIKIAIDSSFDTILIISFNSLLTYVQFYKAKENRMNNNAIEWWKLCENRRKFHVENVSINNCICIVEMMKRGKIQMKWIFSVRSPSLSITNQLLNLNEVWMCTFVYVYLFAGLSKNEGKNKSKWKKAQPRIIRRQMMGKNQNTKFFHGTSIIAFIRWKSCLNARATDKIKGRKKNRKHFLHFVRLILSCTNANQRNLTDNFICFARACDTVFSAFSFIRRLFNWLHLIQICVFSVFLLLFFFLKNHLSLEIHLCYESISIWRFPIGLLSTLLTFFKRNKK